MDLDKKEPLEQNKGDENKIQLQVFCLILGLSILFGGFLAVFILQIPEFQKRYIYPYYYKEEIEKYSSLYQVEAALVLGVIKAESKFCDEVRSDKGAVGLMQLMPATGKEIAESLSYENFSLEALREPTCNIRFGIWYLSTLQAEFNHNDILVLAAYNAGPGNVASWMKEYGWKEDFANLEEIPFGETREYVKKVLKYKQKYREFYYNK